MGRSATTDWLGEAIGSWSRRRPVFRARLITVGEIEIGSALAGRSEEHDGYFLYG
jgi:hypothetical protein